MRHTLVIYADHPERRSRAANRLLLSACSLLSPRRLRHAFGVIALWVGRKNSRRLLVLLDDKLLKDIGFSRADAEREWRKPFWRP